MASTDKTPKLGLNQWAAGDRVLRTDFNADNAKIDAGVQEAMAAAAAAARDAAHAVVKMKSGYILTTGAETEEVNVGFAPKVVLLATPNASHDNVILDKNCLFTFGHYSNALDISNPTNAINAGYALTNNGFRIQKNAGSVSNGFCVYIAFG